jgi:SAM-dependent methyltransferase/acyl carrier protein
MKIIECGSGPGFLISNIVRDLPHCTATAVEIDPFLVDQLNKNSAINGKKLFEVKHASIYETGLPDNYFDFAIARLVLEHLKEPGKAIEEIRRILKPGGKLVLVSNDFAYHLLTYPAIPELDEMYNAYIKSRFSEGGNPLIGRQLPFLLKKGKFEEINIEIICVHSGLEGDKPFLKAENVNISKSLVKDGFLKNEILESLIENWYKMLQQPDHVFFRQLFVISGAKSTKTSVQNDNARENDSTRPNDQSLNFDNLKEMTSLEQESRLGLYFISKVKTILEQQKLDFELHTKLNDIDIDSIAAAELSSIVKSDFNTGISISDILQKFSIHDIIKLILNNLNSYSSGKPDGSDTESGSNWLEGEL